MSAGHHAAVHIGEQAGVLLAGAANAMGARRS
ncbi:hypothetical protein BJ996_007385 [Streptomyces phaeogriseichromatogenes]|nr:hypothetical protein [Streptomyces murinus]